MSGDLASPEWPFHTSGESCEEILQIKQRPCEKSGLNDFSNDTIWKIKILFEILELFFLESVAFVATYDRTLMS